MNNYVFTDTCHFERLTSRGLESDSEYDFHWTTVPAAVGTYSYHYQIMQNKSHSNVPKTPIMICIFLSVCAFPYIMAFAEDLLEIRLVANGSLVHAACIPGLKVLCGKRVSHLLLYTTLNCYASEIIFSTDHDIQV